MGMVECKQSFIYKNRSLILMSSSINWKHPFYRCGNWNLARDSHVSEQERTNTLRFICYSSQHYLNAAVLSWWSLCLPGDVWPYWETLLPVSRFPFFWVHTGSRIAGSDDNPFFNFLRHRQTASPASAPFYKVHSSFLHVLPALAACPTNTSHPDAFSLPASRAPHSLHP